MASLYDLLWYFLIYAFLGWCTEVVFCTVTTGKLVNRGFLNGPVCPIYGFGMTLVLCVLEPFSEHLWLLFIGGVVLTSAVELLGGWALKKFFHTTWWDYSDKPFNIGGYVCLQFSLIWGFCVVTVVRLVHPMFTALVHWVPQVPGIVLLCLFFAVLLTDAVLTVLTILKLNRRLRVIDEMSGRMRRESDAISNELGKLTLKVDAHLDEQKKVLDEKTAAQRESLQAKLDASGARVKQATETMRAEWETQTAHWQRSIQRRLLRAFPDMKNEHAADALEHVRRWVEERRKKD